jgi:hypothetical protein
MLQKVVSTPNHINKVIKIQFLMIFLLGVGMSCCDIFKLLVSAEFSADLKIHVKINESILCRNKFVRRLLETKLISLL